MRVLVLGASGMLGHVMCRVLARQHDVYAAVRARREQYPAFYALSACHHLISGVDLAADGAVDRLLREVRPDVCVNAAGLIKQRSNVNAASFVRLNSLLPQLAAGICDEVGCRLVHVSTDCVFSGTRGAYREDDIPDATDIYGRSKLLGEITDVPHLTLRTSLIGLQLAGHESLVSWFLSQRGRRIRGYANAVFSGVTTEAFAEIVAGLLERPEPLTGLYHLAAEPISKYDLLCKLRDILDLDTVIDRDDSVSVDRSLDARAFYSVTGIAPPSWDAMLRQLAARLGDYERLQDGSRVDLRRAAV
ncbi:MAG: SDR family oxidoreductase [Geminicoccaceae bacterium]